MSTNAIDNRRIAKNAMYLYIRMVITMVITLYTSRIVLQALGVADFGIYNVVAGIILVFEVLNGSLSDSTQRFITFSIGEGDKENVRNTLSICILLHILLGLVVIVVSEPIGLWMIDNKLMIPDDRIFASRWIFQFSVIYMFVTFITVPYNALIIAHERIKAFASITTVEAFLRLIIAFMLLISDEDTDRLILYGLLLLLVQIIKQCAFVIYSWKYIQDSSFHLYWNMHEFKKIAFFSSWTIIGNISYAGLTQGINILLGIFFTPVVNAARGIAVQVQNANINFVRNFQTAINPQITKCYASGKKKEMNSLLFRSSRFSFYLMIFPLIPIFLEADMILKLWLKDVPEYTILFTRIILIISLINVVSNPLGISVKATGNVKKYEICVALVKIMVVPIAYILLKLNNPPQSVFFVYLLFELITFVLALFVTNKLIDFKLLVYIKNVLYPILLVSCISFIVPFLFYLQIQPSITRLVGTILISLSVTSISILTFGLTIEERNFFLKKIKLNVL